MSVAVANNNDQNQVIGLNNQNESPFLKGKHAKDGKEVLKEILKDATEAKAKIAEHLTQVMLQLKASGQKDPLKALSTNPAWQNLVSPELIPLKIATKSDEMNMYMLIFKALSASSQASNIGIVGKLNDLLSTGRLTALIEKTSDQDLADMQAKIQKAHDDYEYAKDHESFWDKLCDALAPVLAVVACVVAIAITVALAPETGGLSLALAGLAVGGGVGMAVGMQGKQSATSKYVSDEHNATETMNGAAGDLSYKTQINQAAISRVQVDTQNASASLQNLENDAESIASVKKTVVEAVTRLAGSN
jgi:hypothetical protein